MQMHPQTTIRHPRTGEAVPAPRNEGEARGLLMLMIMNYNNVLKNTLRETSSPTPLSANDILQIRASTRKMINSILEVWPHRFGDAAYDPIGWDNFFRLQTDKDLLYWRIFRVNDLPPEILHNIFRFFVSSSEDTKSRLYLTWTCRHWRTLAIVDSGLWGSICFGRSPHEMEYMWLERAGTAPLDIRIHEPSEPAASTAEHIVNICRKLFVKLEQIRTFIVIVRSWQQVTAVLKMLAEPENVGRARSLRRFDLYHCNVSWRWTDDGSVSSAGNPLPLCGNLAPSLKHVCLDGVLIDWNRSPLQNLTTLDLRRVPLPLSVSLPRFREILRNCPNLCKLSLHGFGPQPCTGSSFFNDPILLPKLVSLFLGGFALSFVNYILGTFSAPNVRDLTLTNFDGEDYAPMALKMTGMFSQVQLLTMYTVCIGDHPTTKKIMVGWLHSMPNLRYLRIAGMKPHFLHVFLHDPAVYGVDVDEQGLDASNSENNTMVKKVDLGPTDADTQTSITKDILPLQKAGASRVLAPKFTILEYQTMDTQVIVTFGKGRRTIGVPLEKIYVNGPWVSRIDPQSRMDLRNIATLYTIRPGAIVPEESEILGDRVHYGN